MNPRRALAVLLLAVIASGGALYRGSNARWRPADITFARVEPGSGTQATLDISACNADLVAEVRESEEAIAVLVSKRNEWDMDCGGAIVISAKDPVVDRVLVDLSDWRPITMLP